MAAHLKRMPHIFVLLIIASAVCAVYALGQEGTPSSSNQKGCESIEASPFSSRTAPPVVWGEPYTVPAIKLKVVHEQTGQSMAGKMVVVHYVWKWWEYPYPGRPLGVWTKAHEGVKCVTDKDGVVILPEHKVVPRGWYNGKLVKGRKPEFDGFSVQIFIDEHILAKEYSRAEVDELRREKKPTIIFPVN